MLLLPLYLTKNNIYNVKSYLIKPKLLDILATNYFKELFVYDVNIGNVMMIIASPLVKSFNYLANLLFYPILHIMLNPNNRVCYPFDLFIDSYYAIWYI